MAAMALSTYCLVVVAWNAKQHRRHAKGQGNFARGRVFRRDEFHVLGAVAHFLPVEAAFENHRTPGIGGPLKIFFKLGFKARELFLGHCAIAA